MKCKLILVVLLCFVLCDLCTSKTFTRCQLSKELLKIKGIQKTYLGTYTYRAMWNARVIVFVIFLVVIISDAKKIETRCKLVRELLKIGMPNDMFLGQWVCLIEKVSKRDTSLLTVKASGKKLYGLYQIPKEWCREKKRGGLCNISCEALLDDDIRDDTVCALKIAEEKGFKYWPQWTTRCKNDNFITNEIYKCPDLNRLTPERSLSSSLYSRSLQLRRKRSLRSPFPKVTRSKSRHIH